MGEDDGFRRLDEIARPVLADVWRAMGERKRREDAPVAAAAKGEEVAAGEKVRVSAVVGRLGRLSTR